MLWILYNKMWTDLLLTISATLTFSMLSARWSTLWLIGVKDRHAWCIETRESAAGYAKKLSSTVVPQSCYNPWSFNISNINSLITNRRDINLFNTKSFRRHRIIHIHHNAQFAINRSGSATGNIQSISHHCKIITKIHCCIKAIHTINNHTV